jgi:hypothetical protein
MKNFFRSLLKNWKTSVVGIVAIASAIISTWLPQYADELNKVIGILTGLGLLAAKDANKTGV